MLNKLIKPSLMRVCFGVLLSMWLSFADAATMIMNVNFDTAANVTDNLRLHLSFPPGASFERSTVFKQSGTHSGKYRLQRIDLTHEWDRAEHYFPTSADFNFGQEYWFGASFRYHNWVRDTDPEGSPFQVHRRPSSWTGNCGGQVSAAGVAPWLVLVENDQWKWRVKGTDMLREAVPKDQWINVVVHFNITWESSGYVELWVNGVKKFRYTGKTHDGPLDLCNQPWRKPYLNSGIYKFNWKPGRPATLTDVREIYVDSMKLATGADGYSLVDPLNGEPPPPTDTTPPTISNIASSVTDTSATVTWTTNESATSVVRYGKTTAYGSTSSGSGTRTSHSQTLGSLTAGTLYHYVVESVDAAGNKTTSTDRTFTTTNSNVNDVTPPIISGVQATASTPTTATITWTTNEPSTSVVEYGLTTGGSGIALGVNTHHNTTQTVSDLMKSRNFRVARMDLDVNDSITNYRAQASRIRANGGAVEAVLQISYQWNYTCPQNFTTVEQTAYNETYAIVNQLKDVIYDYELLNEIDLRQDTKVQVTPNDAANINVTPYQGKSCYNTMAAVLRGMENAIHAIKASSGYPLRVVLGTTGRDWGMLKFFADNNVEFDVVGYHIYPWSNHTSLLTDTWFGTGGPLAQLQSFAKPVHINEFNCGEIYDSAYSNTPTATKTLECFQAYKKHVTDLAGQTIISQLESLVFYELFDEPNKSGAEAKFGLLYSATSPKDHLYITTAYAGGTLTTSERQRVIDLGILTGAQIDAYKAQSSSYGASVSNPAKVTSHSMALTGLTANTTYHYRVKSSDANNNEAVSGDFVFTTPSTADTVAPVISNVTANVTDTTAVITWATDESSDSTVKYGLTTAYGNSSNDAVRVFTHSRTLTGLSPNTEYHYLVESRDAAGNKASSVDLTFTTTGASSPTHAPVIRTNPDC